MILNRQADDYCRDAALRTLVYAVSEGLFPRQTVTDFLGTLWLMRQKFRRNTDR